MKKKIKVDQLKIGMFIHDFNCGWMDHPFLSNRAKVNDEKTIKKIIKHGIHEVYIDTDCGLDVDDAPTEEEVHQKIQTEINKVAKPQMDQENTTVVQEELVKAKEIVTEATQTVQTLMEEIRMGNQLDLEKADQVVEKMVGSVFRNKDALALLGRIKKTDEYTFYHSVSVSVLMISFAKHLGLDAPSIKMIGIGGLLHDIGKMHISSDILNKPGKLTEEEFSEIMKHAEYSHSILDQNPGINEISVQVASQHHERFDGTGYPNGLKGDEISKYGKMAAIVDVYDAITSDRCYRKGMLPAEAMKKLYEWSEHHFDKVFVEHFISCMGIYPVGTLVSIKHGLLGIVLDPGNKSLLHPTVRVIYNIKKGRHIIPYDVNLSEPFQGCPEGKIESYESPHKWNIKAEMYL
jgi:putative nucleotidyltransferase with HDIG domain